MRYLVIIDIQTPVEQILLETNDLNEAKKCFKDNIPNDLDVAMSLFDQATEEHIATLNY